MNVPPWVSRLSRVLRDRQARRGAALAGAVVLPWLLLAPALLWKHAAHRERTRLQARQTEFLVLAQDYQKVRGALAVREQRQVRGPSASVTQAMEGILHSLGLREKMTVARGTAGRDLPGGLREDGVEVQLDNLTLNETVHLLHRMENLPAPLSIRKAVLRRTFERKDRLDATLTVSLFTFPRAAGR